MITSQEFNRAFRIRQVLEHAAGAFEVDPLRIVVRSYFESPERVGGRIEAIAVLILPDHPRHRAIHVSFVEWVRIGDEWLPVKNLSGPMI